MCKELIFIKFYKFNTVVKIIGQIFGFRSDTHHLKISTWVKNLMSIFKFYKKWCHTGPNFFCHRKKIFFCRPAPQVIFLCTFKHNGKANFKKFLNTGQRVGQRVGTYRYNHIYLNLDAGKFNFKHTCARSQFLKNSLNFKHC